MNTKSVKEVDLRDIPDKGLVMIGFSHLGKTRPFWTGSKTRDGRVLHLSHALTKRDKIVVHAKVLKVGGEVLLTLDEGKKQKVKIEELKVAE